MKKRLLVFSLLLVVCMVTFLPSAVLAKDGWHSSGNRTTEFAGSGLVYATYLPAPVIKGKTWRYAGEIVEGYIGQCDWELLAGTVFWSEHDSVVVVDEEGNAKGVMKGTFTLTRPDGSGTLQGTFYGRIRGNLFTYSIQDTGFWRSTGGTGVFENVKAWGNWSASLELGPIPGTDIFTLVGPLTWEGVYREQMSGFPSGKDRH